MLKEVHVQLQTYAMNCPIMGPLSFRLGLIGLGSIGLGSFGLISFGLVDHLDWEIIWTEVI